MAGTTPFTIGADAICADGACGKLTGIVFDPVARAVTHLVVERRHLERLVPVDLADTAGGEVRIRCTLAEFDKPPAAEKTEFLPGSHHDTGYPPDQVLTRPYYGLVGQDSLTVTCYTLPLGEVAVRRGELVHATDGTIGQVQGLVIDPASHHVTHVLLREGHLFGRKEVAIPISAVTQVDADAVEQVDDNGVRLSLTKQQVQDCRPWISITPADRATRTDLTDSNSDSDGNSGQQQLASAIEATAARLDVACATWTMPRLVNGRSCGDAAPPGLRAPGPRITSVPPDSHQQPTTATSSNLRT